MNAFQFMTQLSESSIAELYQDPWSCQAAFQSLSPLAKHIVLRLLCVDEAVPMTLLNGFVDGDSELLEEALKKVRILLDRV